MLLWIAAFHAVVTACSRQSSSCRHGGAPEWIRTTGPQIRNLMLYPAELRAHTIAHRQPLHEWQSIDFGVAAKSARTLRKGPGAIEAIRGGRREFGFYLGSWTNG